LTLVTAQATSRFGAGKLYPGYQHEFLVCSERTLQTVYRRFYARTGEEAMSCYVALREELRAGRALAAQGAGDGLAAVSLSKFIMSLIRHACYLGASDIGFTPMASRPPYGGVVRLKVGGQGSIFMYLEPDVWMRVSNYLRDGVGSREKLTEGPVDDKFKFSDEQRREYPEIVSRYEFRMALMQRRASDENSLSVVMRILDQQAEAAELSQLPFDPGTTAYLRDILQRSTGLFLVTGPTGSGKTTTLYALLSEIDPVERWIESMENPIEYTRGMWMQFQMNMQAGRGGERKDEGDTASMILKGLLRAAPDVILVGEVRKGDLGRELVDAGNTGHLVFSTLHNNNAAMAITRLRSFDLDMSSVASLLLGVLAQRLVRTLCACSAPDDCLETQALLANKSFLKGYEHKPRKAVGCLDCGGTGYRGRRMIFEQLRITPEVRGLIENGDPPSVIAAKGIEPGNSLVANGLKLVAQGITSIDEVARLGPLED
jgi:type II secretory ATPase GspE/PulE/Tfp pilus assembly ATPase PilB-like protein